MDTSPQGYPQMYRLVCTFIIFINKILQAFNESH